MTEDADLPIGDGLSLSLRLTESELRFLRRHAEISEQARAEEAKLRRAYEAHLAAGGARIYFKDGRELLT